MEELKNIQEIVTPDEALIEMLFRENSRLQESNQEAARHIEFLTVECQMWRKIHEADQAAIEAIIKQMGG